METELKVMHLVGSEYTQELIKLINLAQQSICILMFDWRWYTHDPHSDMQLINQSLVRAVRRGVKVRAITHFHSAHDMLQTQGIDVKPWKKASVMHAKFVLVDSFVMVQGSHNFSQRAMTSNMEISSLSVDAVAGKKMYDFFDSLWRSST